MSCFTAVLWLGHLHRFRGAVPAASAQPAPAKPAPVPLMIGGVEFSHEDDIENMEKLSNLFGQVFYTHVLSPENQAAAQSWQSLQNDIWLIAEMALEIPALALSTAMCLYNFFWWEGPQNNQPNVLAGYEASQLMYLAVKHAGCHEPQMEMIHFYIKQCHLRWRYLLMLTAETGRFLLRERSLGPGTELMKQARAYMHEMKQLPNIEFFQGFSTHEVSFNLDYYPYATLLHGPVWKNPHQRLPVASVLEEHYPVIRAELESILKAGTFQDLDSSTRNAETQFGPRGDDWLTAYLFRQGRRIEETCQHAPRTCDLLQSRPEIANCRSGASGAGFLRMRPGGRLKPHFGNAPRLSVHLGLIIPDGEIFMSVGYEDVRWEEGKVIVFDDTFIHQVIHNGKEPRYVMNLWMCHPCDPYDGRSPDNADAALPDYCQGPPGAMLRLGLEPLAK